jgi:ketosteroid isomerase-like protein
VSQENVEIVRALVERWNRGDRSFAESGIFDPAFELESPLSSVSGEPYRGRTGIERWLLDLDEQFATWTLNLEEVREVDDNVLAIGAVLAQGRASGVALEFTAAVVADFDADHRITRARIYLDASEALKAAGLEE